MAMSVSQKCQKRATSPKNHAVNMQWKGTDVCMDFTCECEVLLHYHGMFMTFIRCDQCQAVYWMNPTVEAVKLTDAECVNVEAEGWNPKGPETSDDD
jgi:hypothetical protein